jgi:hypothetical protein
VQRQEAGSFAHHTPEPVAETLRERREMLAMGANLSAFPPFLKGGRGDFGY